jgi:hypothetical protein
VAKFILGIGGGIGYVMGLRTVRDIGAFKVFRSHL